MSEPSAEKREFRASKGALDTRAGSAGPHKTDHGHHAAPRAERVARSATERTCPPISLAGSSIHNQPDLTTRATKTIAATVTMSATTARTALHPIPYGVSCVSSVTLWGR